MTGVCKECGKVFETSSAVCQCDTDHELLKDENGKTLHPTQKPEKLISHLMTIFSNRGDLVFDGFFGTGTTAAVAKALGRKFVGFEKEEKFFMAAQKRLAAKEEEKE